MCYGGHCNTVDRFPMVVVNMEKYYRLRGDGSVKPDVKKEKEVAPFWNDFLGPTSLHFGVTSLDRSHSILTGLPWTEVTPF